MAGRHLSSRMAAQLASIWILIASVIVFSFQGADADYGSTRSSAARPELDSALSAGGFHTCAVLSDGSLWCWGRNADGQLGTGNTNSSTTPVRVGSGSNWQSVSAGGSSTCAVNVLGELWCWGSNTLGKLGLGDTSTRTSPTKVTSLGSSVESVSVGPSSMCAVTTAGAVKCSGSNAYGQLGDGTTTARTTPVQVTGLTTGIAAVGVGFDFACAMRDAGSVVCWGSDLHGYRGDGSGQTTNTAAPSEVSSITSASAISVGEYTTCIVLSTQGVRCWGDNSDREIQESATQYFESPVIPNTHVNTAAFATGNGHTCSVSSAGSITCRGRDDRGQGANRPTAGSFLAITAGEYHSCAIDDNQQLHCWGSNPYGELGNSNTTSYPNYADGPAILDFGALDTVGSTLPPEPPSAPQSLVAYAGAGQITVGWQAPASSGDSAITDYEYRVDSGSGYGSWVSLGSTGTFVRLASLQNGVQHSVEVRAVSAVGAGLAASAVTATPTEPCDPLVDCEVGDVGPGGGVIYYDGGSNRSWGRFIEAAPVGWSESIEDPLMSWGCNGTTVSGTTYSYGAGGTNTTAILANAACATSAAATAGAATTMVGGSVVDDWVLPSSYDLNMLIDRTAVVPGLDPAGDSAYWSSRASSSTTAYVGGNATESRNNSNRVRPVRYVAGPEAPTSPRNVAVRPTIGGVAVDWDAPLSAGTAAITDLEYRLSTDGGSNFGSWTSLGSTSGSGGIGGLVNGTTYTVQLRAVSAHGESSEAPLVADTAALARATATPSLSCDAVLDCEVGSVGPAGGVIVYDAGQDEAWGRYLEVAPQGWSGSGVDPTMAWGCDGVAIGGVGQSTVGTGAANTAAIAAGCPTSAAAEAIGFSTTVNSADFEDWFLPSLDELALVLAEADLVAGWNTTDASQYWSSTEVDNALASAGVGSTSKSVLAGVRPIRYVSGPAVVDAPVLVAAAGDGRIDVEWSAPSTTGTAPLDDVESRISSDGGGSWSAWTSRGVVTELAFDGLANGTTYEIEIRFSNRGGVGSSSSTGPVTPLAPPPSTTSTTSTSSTSTTTTTIAPSATTSTTTVAGNSSSVPATTSPSNSVTTTTSSPVSGPLLITSPSGSAPVPDDRAPSPPGRGRVIVDGELIEVEVIRVPPDVADRRGAERSSEDIALIRTVAEQMIAELEDAAGPGFVSPVSIRYTDTGAVFVGLLVNPESQAPLEIPVEEVNLVVGGGLALMVGGLADDGSTDVVFNGVLRLGAGGWIGVIAAGLDPSGDGSVVVMSEPRLLGRFTPDRFGSVSVQVRVPGDLPIGDHTAVVSAGSDTASLGFEVVGSDALPTTGARSRLQPVALLLLTLGALIALIGTSRGRLRAVSPR